MFSQFLNKMTETQRSKIEELISAKATLTEILCSPDVVS